MASGTWSVFKHGAHLQPWSLSSGTGSIFRYSERLHAQGVTSGTGSHCALQAQVARLGTGLALRHRAHSGKGCAVTHGVRPQRVLVPFRQRECLQEWGVPSGMVSGFRNWRLCAASTGAWRLGAGSTEPGGLEGILCLPLFLSFPGRFRAETTEPGGCLEFCVWLSLSFPCDFFRHWECQLQALAVKTSGTGSNHCSH